MSVLLPTLLKRLKENRLGFVEIPLQAGASLVAPGFGGRLLGPFFQPDEPAVFWTHPACEDAGAFREFLTGAWNLGGDRFWISPEVQFLVRDRRDYFGTITLPPAMDPGNWQAEELSAGGVRLSMQAELEAYNLTSGVKQFSMEVEVRPVPNPLRSLAGADAWLSQVEYLGYEEIATLSEHQRDGICGAVWNLIQVQTGGQALIPAAAGAQVTDYVEPVDSQHLQRTPGGLAALLDGRQRYKIGFQACETYGRLGYIQRMADGRDTLTIRQFTNNPSSDYLDEPSDNVGQRGDSIYLYNDNGSFGRFGELECQGQAVGGPGGAESCTDRFLLWLFRGQRESLSPIAQRLLGMDLPPEPVSD